MFYLRVSEAEAGRNVVSLQVHLRSKAGTMPLRLAGGEDLLNRNTISAQEQPWVSHTLG